MNKIKVYFKFPNKSKPINVQEKKSADDRQEQAKYENIPIPSSEMKNIATEIKKIKQMERILLLTQMKRN